MNQIEVSEQCYKSIEKDLDHYYYKETGWSHLVRDGVWFGMELFMERFGFGVEECGEGIIRAFVFYKESENDIRWEKKYYQYTDSLMTGF